MIRLFFPVFISIISSLPAFAAPTDFSLLREQMSEARKHGDLDKADRLARDYLALASAQQDPQELGLAHHHLGNNAIERNNYPVAKQHLEQAISLLKQKGQTKALADALRRLGMTYRYQSNYAKALENVYQAMQIYQALQDQFAIASTYSSIGTILEKMGQYEEALQAHQQSLDLHYQLKDEGSISSAIYNLGELNRTLGDTDKALHYFLQALQMDIASGDKRNIAYSHNKLSYLYSDLGDFDKAKLHVTQALALFEQIGARRDTDWARTVVAKLAMEQGDYAKAQQLLDDVIERALQHSYKSLLVDAYKMAAELALKKADDVAALQYIEAGIELTKQTHERADEAQLQQMRVDAYIRQDSVRDALNALLQQKQLQDTIFNSKRAASIAAIQAQTEYTRQQHQIELLQNEQALQQARLAQDRLTRNFWFFGLIAAFILIISLYRRYIQLQQNRRLALEVSARTQELEQKNAELSQAYQQLEVISLTDKLTGLYNRHFLESHIDTELEQVRRLQQDWQNGKTSQPEPAELAVFLIDLDHFKALNDNYGHHAGDEVLQQFKLKMQQVFRQSDYLVRWGGEEFVVVVRHISRVEVSLLARRFVEAVQQTPFNLTGFRPVHISCSLGYVCYPLPLGPYQQHWHNLLKLADLCLYAAKYSGRNGWVGLENLATGLQLQSAAITAVQMQLWHDQGLLQLQHSFSSLNWQV